MNKNYYVAINIELIPFIRDTILTDIFGSNLLKINERKPINFIT